MAEFKKEPPKDEAIKKEVLDAILQGLAGRIVIDLQRPEDFQGIELDVSMGGTHHSTRIPNDRLEQLDALEYLNGLGKEISQSL